MRLHLDNYQTTLASPASIGATSVTVVDEPGVIAAGEYFLATIADSATAPTKMDKVRVTANAAGVLTVEPALANDYAAGAVLAEWVRAEHFDKADGLELLRYRETVATVTSGNMDRSKGGIALLTLTTDSALTWTLNNGEKIQLYLTPAGFNVTDWGVTHWMTDVPTLATENMIVVEKVGGNIYAWDGGSR